MIAPEVQQADVTPREVDAITDDANTALRHGEHAQLALPHVLRR
jgi:hypothetical protein